jgi:hypothetical protein
MTDPSAGSSSGPSPSDRVEPRESSRFLAFDDLIETCRRTRAALVAVVHERSGDGVMIREIIAGDGLTHVDAVRAGLTALARATQFHPAELRDLVRREGIGEPPRDGPEALAAASEAAHCRPPLRPADGDQILAAGHARIVFSVIPMLPPEAVTWPRVHRTYADIPTPRSEAELFARVDELARVLWRVAEGRPRHDEPMRRALAFYETGSRLSLRGGFTAA